MYHALMLVALVSLLPSARPAALTAAAAKQGGDLKLSNVRLTIGELGGPRPSAKLLPGDVLFIGYDINGLTIDGDGTAKYKMSMEVRDAADKSIFKQDPRELIDFVPLRGTSIPARAFITIGLDQDPGTYTCKIRVEDPKVKGKEDTVTVKFEVLKRDFGIVAVYSSHDERGQFAAPTTGVVGQTLFVQFSVASFQRDAKTKQPNIELQFQLTDDKGTPTLEKPRTHIQDSGVEAADGAFGMRFPVFMNRPGKFTVQLTATDKVANKKVTYELPLTVLPAN
ncbi:unnamed protein product [Gemmataceae bacterium]|jgi:hypothetical protein|nr:unnamed protein product [Gemmataceae bacterium]VTT96364.1 unnamed protein product [Gemmataceae bacterium]